MFLFISCKNERLSNRSQVKLEYKTTSEFKLVDSLVERFNTFSTNKISFKVNDENNSKNIIFTLLKPRVFKVSPEVVIIECYDLLKQNKIFFDDYILIDEFENEIQRLNRTKINSINNFRISTNKALTELYSNHFLEFRKYMDSSSFQNISDFELEYKKLNIKERAKFIGFDFMKDKTVSYCNLYYNFGRIPIVLTSDFHDPKYKFVGIIFNKIND